MKSITHHEGITQVAFPEQLIPVLVPVNESRRAGISEAPDGYFFKDVTQQVFVRAVSEDLRTLTVPENRKAFEAKYGLAIYDNPLKNAFFSLMLAEGQDPKRVLQYYRGSWPGGIFQEGAPVNQGIQQNPLGAALETLNRGLDTARPVVWWSSRKNRASLGLFCPDAHSAIFALALRGMGLPGALGVCQRCGNPFLRSRRTQRFCSHRCQLAASMRRFRERHGLTEGPKNRKKSRRRKAARRSKR